MNTFFRKFIGTVIIFMSLLISLPDDPKANYIYGGTCMEFLETFQSTYFKRTDIEIGDYEKHQLEDGTYIYYLDLLPEEKESFVRMYMNTGRDNDYLQSVSIFYKADDKLSRDRARTAMLITYVAAGMTSEELEVMKQNKKVNIKATDITMHITLREGDDVNLLNHVMPGKSFLIYLD